MKQFKKLIKEINSTLSELILFDVVINVILIFLSIYLFCLDEISKSGIIDINLTERRREKGRAAWLFRKGKKCEK